MPKCAESEPVVFSQCLKSVSKDSSGILRKVVASPPHKDFFYTHLMFVTDDTGDHKNSLI